MADALTIIIFILILPLIPIYIFIEINRKLSKRVAKLMSTLFADDEPLTAEEEKRQAFHRNGDRILGYLIGGVGAVTFIVFAIIHLPKDFGLVVFLFGIPSLLLTAFRSGGELTRVIAYAQHDLRMIREKAEGLPFGRFISKALTPPIVLNTLMGIASVISIPAIKNNDLAEEGFGSFLPYLPTLLWALGLAYGYVHAFILTKGNPNFLLRDDLGVAAFMGILKVDKEVKKVGAAISKLPKPPSLKAPPMPKRPSMPKLAGKKEK